jgi:CoA:oxalate CoA-transferase
VLACLVRRGVTGQGGYVETTLIEALVDLQFEVLTTHLNDGGRLPARSAFRNAHAYLAAPYGVYRTQDGWLALAMTPLGKLAPLLGMEDLAAVAADPGAGFTRRDEIKRMIAARLATATTAQWLALLQPADVWCADVLDWPRLLGSEGFAALDLLQTVTREDGVSIRTTRAPLRIDGVRPRTDAAAPRIGAHTATLRAEFGL